MLFLNVATSLKAPLLGLLALFGVGSPPAPDTDDTLQAPVEVNAAETLHWEEDFPRGGGLDGIDEEFDAGQDCGGLQRTRAEASVVSGKGDCTVAGWVSEDPKDCRVRVRIAIGPFGWAICRVRVFVEQ